MTHKQELFKNYLIKKIGFIEDTFLNKYIPLLEAASPKLKLLGKQKKVWSEDRQRYLPEKEDSHNTYIEKENYFIPEKFNVIDLLNIELNTKKSNDYTSKDLNLKFISATDISNFTYCPVSFAISKTFELPKLESAILGTSQHEKQILIRCLRPSIANEYISFHDAMMTDFTRFENPFSLHSVLNDENKLFFDELSESSVIFYGHHNNETKNKYFKSTNGGFVGQPDYIFKNDTTNDIFVVEEKFQFVPKDPSNFYYSSYSEEEEKKIIEKRTRKSFFNNHINQLSSYIYGIGEYDIRYGYLVYWKYELDNKNPNIVGCDVLRIEKTENGRKQIRDIFISLKKLITDKSGVFDIDKRVPAKCANCVSNLLCGHKTGRFTAFSVPYSKDYLKIYFAPFPEGLKKEVLPTESNSTSAQTPTDSPP